MSRRANAPVVEIAIAGGAVAVMNAFTLLTALVITAALGSGAAQRVALLGFAAVYLVASWRALGRLAADRGWTTFRRQLVFATGQFLMLRFVLEIAAASMLGLSQEP